MPHNYDLVLAGYPMEPATAAYGVRTPVVTSSYDDVMVLPKDTAATQRGLWSFAEPFHWTLWVAVIFSMATTGVLFVAFEYGTADEFSPPHSRCAWVVEVIRVVKQLGQDRHLLRICIGLTPKANTGLRTKSSFRMQNSQQLTETTNR